MDPISVGVAVFSAVMKQIVKEGTCTVCSRIEWGVPGAFTCCYRPMCQRCFQASKANRECLNCSHPVRG